MTTFEETAAQAIIEKFLKASLPEYLLAGASALLESGGVMKIRLNKLPERWEIEGSVQGDDLEIYSSNIILHMDERRADYLCNCMDCFSGACMHVGAVALKFLASLNIEKDTPQATPLPKNEWRDTFRAFMDTEIEPEIGRHHLVFRFYPEPDRLQVAFFRARQNKSGLSTVHSEITLAQIVDNPDWCEFSPELPKVAAQIMNYLDYSEHRVLLPHGFLSWFFWAIRNEHYRFVGDTDIPCLIRNTPFYIRMKPELDDLGLNFDIQVQAEGKPPYSLVGKEVYFYGHLPIWSYRDNSFFPVSTQLPAQIIRGITKNPPHIPRAELSEFLDRIWPQLPRSALNEQESFLEQIQPLFANARYNPKLFLNEEGSLLTLEIENIYETEHGDFALPGPDPDLQTGSARFEDSTLLIRREPEAELALINRLMGMNFHPRNSRTWTMDTEQAIDFLLDHYPKLVEDYRVFGETALSRYKVRLTAPVISAEVESKKDDDSWFEFNIKVEYNGQAVPMEKLWKAWTQGKRYVQLKDGSYASLPEAWLKSIGHKLRTLGLDPDKPPKQQFQKYEATTLDKILEDIPVVRTDSFWDALREKLHSFSEIKQLEPPKDLNAQLRSYQLQGLSYLNFLHEYNFGGILADEMGLGKTVQTLAFLQYRAEKVKPGPSLIVVPTSVLPNWDHEAAKFVPNLKRLIIYGTKREDMFAKIADADIVITTYALLRRDMEELCKYEFSTLILDEAQNIKNPNTITARSVRQIKADLRLCLSGTPIENNLLELWSLFEFLMPGFLGSQHAFQRGIVKPIKDGDTESLDYLRSRVRPFILRRTKSEVAKDLPPKVETVQYCALTDEQSELYAALTKRLREEVLSDVDQKGIAKSQISILDALLKLRQICCHPRLLKLEMPGFSTNLPSGKFDAFKDIVVDIVEEGNKVLVFSQFVQMLQIIRSWLHLSEIPCCYLDGSVKDRHEEVERFNNDPSIPVFLISLKAGGTGINLTSANYVIHYDPWWNPAVENQATDRAHRIGQVNTVFSYKMICQNTVEEKILKLQSLKKDVADAIIPGQDSLKNLTREDLEMLFEV